MKYLLLILLLSSCVSYDKGLVVEKLHEPGQYDATFTPTLIQGETYMVPHWYWDNEDFVLIVVGKRHGKPYRERWYLSKSEWEQVQLAQDWYKKGTTEDPNNIEINGPDQGQTLVNIDTTQIITFTE